MEGSKKLEMNSVDTGDDSDGSDDSDATTTSSSHERLTREEKLYVLRHTRRQDPQGEEQQHRNCAADSASSCRTLIIHGSLSDESWARIAGTGSIPDLGLGGSQHYLTSTPTGAKAPSFRPASEVPLDADDFLLGSSERRRRRNVASTPTNSFSTRSLPRSAKDFSSLTHRPGPLFDEQSQPDEECCERRKQMMILQNLAREMNWSLPVKTDQVSKGDHSEEAACSALSISDTLLVNNENQASTVIVHDQSLTRDFSYLTKPPPAYPRSSKVNESRNSSAASSVRRTKVRRALSRSHPDLSKLGKDLKPSLSVTAPVTVTENSWRTVRQKADLEDFELRKKETASKVNEEQASGLGDKCERKRDKNDAVWSTPELVDAILEENFKLRQQVQQHADNIAKLHKFERELGAVHSAHQSLVRSSERKETLERAARLRLEAEWRRAQEMNAALRNQIELLTSQLALKSASVSSISDSSSSDVANQIGRRDALIAQLVSQNKELVAHKERQDIELCAQKATLQQQRSHIEILESALSRAQMHVNRLEDEFRRQCGDARHLLGSGGAACESNDASANRELANMEIRIRDLEAKLAEKEMLIHLLQRASMDRELGYSATRPLTESVLSRHPSSVTSHHSSQTQQDVNNANLTPASSKNVRAASVGCTSLRSKASVQQPAESQTSQPASEATQSLDNQLRALDQFYQNKHSLIKALQTDKELFPNNYWAS